MLRKSLAQLFLDRGQEETSWDQLARIHLRQEGGVLGYCKKVLEGQDLPSESSVDAWILEWRRLIAAHGLSLQYEKEAELQWLLTDLSRRLALFPFWSGFQLPEVMRGLSCHFTGLPFSIPKPVQLDSGAIPRESSGHWEQGALPHLIWQADLGFFWALAGRLMDREDLLTAAKKVGEWQLNALDAHYRPFRALYSREGEFAQASLLQSLYALFHSLALFTGKGEWEYVADRHLTLLENAPGKIDPERALLMQWVEQLAPVPQPHYVPRLNIDYDPDLGFRSIRESGGSLCVSGYVSGASIASFCGKEAGVVAMGPQGGDLGDCRHFGLWTGKDGIRYSEDSGGFQLSLSGRSGHFLDGGSVALHGRAKKDPCWLDVDLVKRGGSFTVDVRSQRLPGSSKPIYFSFFVTGNSVHVGGQKLRLQSLERYRGSGALLSVVAEDEELILHSSGREVEVEVIPLAGGDNFWGADFLVAYTLADQQSLKWELQLVPRAKYSRGDTGLTYSGERVSIENSECEIYAGALSEQGEV